MQFPKAFSYDGDKLKPLSLFFYLVGMVGAVILLHSLSINKPQLGYIIGSSFLLSTAIYFNLFFFIALELILISGHTAIMLGVGSYLQLALPVLLCTQLLVFYYLSDMLNNPYRILGIIGIAMLSIGFAYNHAFVFISGSLCISTFSFYAAFKGRYPCYIWAILNFLFAIIIFLNLITL